MPGGLPGGPVHLGAPGPRKLYDYSKFFLEESLLTNGLLVSSSGFGKHVFGCNDSPDSVPLPVSMLFDM